jgi:hypothetical protein
VYLLTCTPSAHKNAKSVTQKVLASNYAKETEGKANAPVSNPRAKEYWGRETRLEGDGEVIPVSNPHAKEYTGCEGKIPRIITSAITGGEWSL